MSPAGDAVLVRSGGEVACVTTAALGELDAVHRPRWVWWGQATAAALLAAGVRPSVCWDVATVQRLLFGGWRTEPARIWAELHGLATDGIPALGQLDLLGTSTPSDSAYLAPELTAGGWAADVESLTEWASAAFTAAALQRSEIDSRDPSGRLLSTARSESSAELLCAELAAIGLPISIEEASAIIASYVGPQPRTEAEASGARAARDEAVLQHVAGRFDLRNPAQVKAMLEREGIEVSDTRAWRLEALRDAHPVVPALLEWRKAERIATTFGYTWLDAHVGGDGRLRGEWTSCDGGAGRMTAQAGLHNMPAELRPAVHAGPGWAFVRADLGQIEPRVLAAVSGDRAFAEAAQADDLYLPVARRLRVERPIAKVAVLAAMYGQTSGAAGKALEGMERAYPVAMAYLRAADEAGREGRNVTTYGGRVIHVRTPDEGLPPSAFRAAAASWGRFTRNAVVQGAAAELFKAWAATVRARLGASPARIVLCLHDELLVHCPVGIAAEVADIVAASLTEASSRWHPESGVRFVTDLSIIDRWSDAKG